MNPVQADDVISELSAGFPGSEWPDATIDLWRREMQAVGAREGMLAAGAVVRGHRYLTMAAFFEELAAIRARHLDENRSPARPNFDQLALGPGERWAPDADNRAALRELADFMRQRAVRDRRLVEAGAGDGRPRWQRPDEDYFNHLAAREAAEVEPEPPVKRTTAEEAT